MSPEPTTGEVAIPARLPTDALVLLVGPSGAGKSTWAEGSFDAGDVLSSDRCRAMVAGDAADQSATADAFRLLHLVAAARLRRGLLTVVDATNLTSRARHTLLRSAAIAGRPAAAVVFDVSVERCLRQNAARSGRSVPQAVIRRHHAELQMARALIPEEGYTQIHVLRDQDLSASLETSRHRA